MKVLKQLCHGYETALSVIARVNTSTRVRARATSIAKENLNFNGKDSLKGNLSTKTVSRNVTLRGQASSLAAKLHGLMSVKTSAPILQAGTGLEIREKE